MAFLLILDREHKVLWVKNKNRSTDDCWFLPEIEDPIKKPVNRLNVELLAKQAFIPLKSCLVGKKNILDIYQSDQQLYLFLCTGKEASEVLFDLTKYRDIQWVPINCVQNEDIHFLLSGKEIIQAYHEIFLNGFMPKNQQFHIVKNGYRKQEVEQCNQKILKAQKRLLVELKDQYIQYRQPLPKCGEYSLLNNWKGFPVALLEITDVQIVPLKEIEKTIMQMNGQQDKDFDILYPDKEYLNIFKRWFKSHNQKLTNDKQVIFSRFRVIERLDAARTEELEST